MDGIKLGGKIKMSFWKDVGKSLFGGAAGVLGATLMTKAIQKWSESEESKKKKKTKKPVEKKTSAEEVKEIEAE